MALAPHISLLTGVEAGATEGVVERLRPVTVREHWKQKKGGRRDDESTFIAPISSSYDKP